MSFRSLAFQRCALSLAAVLLVSACTEDGRKVPLSGVETVEIPVADVDNQTNQNINNPTLFIPESFPVADGDLLRLVWSDEFDAAQLDPEEWFYETGDGSQYGFGQSGKTPGWGNNELQYYLPDSVQLVDGVLQITARRESAEGYNFTSGRINTQDRFAFKYGRIEASIKLPSGQGLWPAFWMLSQDSPYGEWAATGEIDVVEAVNLDGTGGNDIFGTIHFGGEFPANTSAETRYTPSVDVTEDFHTYAFEWDEFEMRWYFDGVLYKVENSWFSSAGAYPAPFDQPFYLLFNLAVGGNFPGSPDGSTPLPATLEVDWVRVYSGEAPPVVPADPGTIPDVVLYASDPGVPIDLEFGVDYTSLDPFGSGSAFDAEFASDADFSPAFAVTTGNGYGAQVGQLGILGFATGFAEGYTTLDFKAKGLNSNLIRVKFLDSPSYVDIALDTSPYSTELGNGWYQVSVPIADFSGVPTATGLLFETDNTSPGAFTFLLTDIGFSGGSGGGADPGVVPDDVIYATDPGEVIDLVATVSAFGTTSQFDGAYALDADFNPSFEVISGTGYGIPHIAQLGLVGLPAGFAADYESFSFKIKSADLPGNLITVKLEAGGAYGNVVLSDTSVSTALGNDWYQVVLPMSGFADVANAVGVVFEAQDQNNGFSFLLTDIGFNNPAAGGNGLVPDPGFEAAGTAGFQPPWFAFDNGGTVSASDVNSNGGTYAARLQADASSGAASFPILKVEALGAGTLTNSAAVTITFDAIDVDATGVGKVFVAELFTERSDPPGGATNEVILGGYGLSSSWQTYTFTTNLGADAARGVSLLFKADCGANPVCTMDIFIDNVSIVTP